MQTIDRRAQARRETMSRTLPLTIDFFQSPTLNATVMNIAKKDLSCIGALGNQARFCRRVAHFILRKPQRGRRFFFLGKWMGWFIAMPVEDTIAHVNDFISWQPIPLIVRYEKIAIGA